MPSELIILSILVPATAAFGLIVLSFTSRTDVDNALVSMLQYTSVVLSFGSLFAMMLLALFAEGTSVVSLNLLIGCFVSLLSMFFGYNIVRTLLEIYNKGIGNILSGFKVRLSNSLVVLKNSSISIVRESMSFLNNMPSMLFNQLVLAKNKSSSYLNRVSFKCRRKLTKIQIRENLREIINEETE